MNKIKISLLVSLMAFFAVIGIIKAQSYIQGYLPARNQSYADTFSINSGLNVNGNFILMPTGKVGIGTSTPVGQLSASSTRNIVAVFDQRGTKDILQVRDLGVQIFNIKDGGFVGVNSSTPASRFSIQPATGESSFTIGSTTKNYFRVNKNGRIGIGTTTPGFLLSVGTMTASTTLDFSRSCIQMNNAAGIRYHIYVTNAGTVGIQIGNCP